MSDDEEERTIWCGNLSEKVTYDILYELFYQAGPLDRIKIPRNADGLQRNFGFVTYTHKESVFYAIDLFKGTCLYDRELRMQVRKNARGSCTPSTDLAMLLGRPLVYGSPDIDPNVEQKFVAMTNQMIISGGCNNLDFGNYEQAGNNGQPQSQWANRHNSHADRDRRRHDPYRKADDRKGRDWDRNRRDRERDRSNGSWDRGSDRWRGRRY